MEEVAAVKEKVVPADLGVAGASTARSGRGGRGRRVAAVVVVVAAVVAGASVLGADAHHAWHPPVIVQVVGVELGTAVSVVGVVVVVAAVATAVPRVQALGWPRS